MENEKFIKALEAIESSRGGPVESIALTLLLIAKILQDISKAIAKT